MTPYFYGGICLRILKSFGLEILRFILGEKGFEDLGQFKKPIDQAESSQVPMRSV